jgi:hexosaminidase
MARYQYITDVQSAWSLTEAELAKIQGSETLIWTEMVDDSNIAQKLWPRSAALAEALWTYTAAPVIPAISTASTHVTEGKYGLRGIDAYPGRADGGQVGGWYEAEPRMQRWRNRLVQRGVPAEALLPLWCQQRADHVCSLNQGTPQ